MRFATIGTSSIADDFVKAGRLCPDFTLQAVYSRNAERAAEKAREWGAPTAYHDSAAMAADRDVDAVYIASPNSMHAAQAEQFLQAGKHVLCEKPAVTNQETFIRLLALAKKNKLVLMEAMRPAHQPAMQAIRKASSRLGNLRRALLSYCQYSSRYDKFKEGIIENAFDPTLQGGALMDIGVYCVASMVMLFGTPAEITARGWFLPGSIDAAGSLLAEYAGGLQAQLCYSKVNNSFLPCEIQGEKGCLQFSPLSIPARAEIIWNDGSREPVEFETSEHDMVYEIRDFIECAATGASYELYSTITRETLAMLDEARHQIGIEFVKVML